MTTTAYKTVAQSLGVPESYVSSRSTRQVCVAKFACEKNDPNLQGYGTSAVLGHISRNPATVWSECVKQAQQSLNWKTQSSVEHYLKAPGGELQACLKRVQLLVRRDPRLAQVDAFRYFTHLSQMRLLEGYRELDEDEQLAVQEEGECAYETRQTNAEKEGEVLRRLAENHEQEGRYPEARMARDQATKLTDAKAKASWKRMKAHATQSAKSILLSEIIDEAMGKMHSVPELVRMRFAQRIFLLFTLIFSVLSKCIQIILKYTVRNYWKKSRNQVECALNTFALSLLFQATRSTSFKRTSPAKGPLSPCLSAYASSLLCRTPGCTQELPYGAQFPDATRRSRRRTVAR